MAVMDRPLTGPEAAALYTERIQGLREHDEREQVTRHSIMSVLRSRGRRAPLTDVITAVDLPLHEFLEVLQDLLDEGVVVAHGSHELTLVEPERHSLAG